MEPVKEPEDIEDLNSQMERYFVENIKPHLDDFVNLSIIGYTFIRQRLTAVEADPQPPKVILIPENGDEVKRWYDFDDKKSCPAMDFPD